MNENAKEGIYIYSKSKILDLAMDAFTTTLESNGLTNVADALLQIDSLRK